MVLFLHSVRFDSGKRLMDNFLNNYYFLIYYTSIILYQGRLEAANRNTRSSDLANPSICTNSSVFMRLLPSCSLLQGNQITQELFIQSLPYLWMSFWSYLSVRTGIHYGSLIPNPDLPAWERVRSGYEFNAFLVLGRKRTLETRFRFTRRTVYSPLFFIILW